MPAPNRPGGIGSDRDLSAPDLGQAARANEELTRQLGDTEERLEALRARYDMWFIGIERREPARERDELKREVNRLKTAFTHNTGLKFRIQTLHARFIAYERMWQRSSREKEEGTYRRDVMRMRRANRAPPAKAAPAAEAKAKVAAPQSAPQVPAPPGAAAVPGMTDAQLRALHASYVDAKRRCNEDVSKLSLEALAKSVTRQMPDLVQRFKGRAVEFRVVVKEGRAVLKASPK